MSGIAGGVLVVPLVLGVGPILSAAMVVTAFGAAAYVVSRAASTYERNTRAKREAIRRGEAARTQETQEEFIGSFRDKVLTDMTAETRRNAEVSNRMAQELEKSRNETRALLEGGDPEKYAQYLKQIQNSRVEMNKKIVSMQDEFTRGYREKIATGMEEVNREINRRAGRIYE